LLLNSIDNGLKGILRFLTYQKKKKSYMVGIILEKML
jgi:hypothetical protein